jgi:hypothetical protein
MISHSLSIVHLMGAMLKVQGAVDGVVKDAANPAFKTAGRAGKYASLESVVDTIRPECQKNGLVVMQAPGACRDGVLTVETFIAHAESGEWIRSASELPVAKNDPQGAGSAITYAERYSLMALFNLPPVDDDGNEASREMPRPQRPQAVQTQPDQPITNPNAPTTFDGVAETMGATIRRCGSADALEALRTDPGFVRQFKALPLALQATIGEVIKKKRQQFGEAA